MMLGTRNSRTVQPVMLINAPKRTLGRKMRGMLTCPCRKGRM